MYKFTLFLSFLDFDFLKRFSFFSFKIVVLFFSLVLAIRFRFCMFLLCFNKGSTMCAKNCAVMDKHPVPLECFQEPQTRSVTPSFRGWMGGVSGWSDFELLRDVSHQNCTCAKLSAVSAADSCVRVECGMILVYKLVTAVPCDS